MNFLQFQKPQKSNKKYIRKFRLRRSAKKIKKLDPEYYQKVDEKNHSRLIRALEVCLETQSTYSSFLKNQKKKRPFSVIKIAIDWDRKLLYERINHRVDEMMAKGLLKEPENLYPYKLQTVGYKEITRLFRIFNPTRNGTEN